jgi:serine/threonine-protein kinase
MHPERIGKYRILGEIGRGTMGEVLKALDPVLNRQVALKTLSHRVGPADEALERFQREARAAALLKHPNIVTIHDFGEEHGVLYMAMELLEGTDLRDAIDNDSLETLDEKLDIMDQVLGALDHAHRAGVVHRDVKPANIHLGPDRQVKIMDFGLARLSTSEMTQEGIVLGTPNYMSPEQALGDKVDGRSDLFSIGAVLYELLSGHKPFEADSTPSVLYQVVHKEPPPIQRWVPDVPAPLVAVVNRALDKNREKRFQTAGEMRASLAAARRAVAAAPAPRPQPPPLPASARPARNGRTTTPPPVVAPPSLRIPTPPATGTFRGRAGRKRSGLGALVLLGTSLVALLLVLLAMAAWLRSRPATAPGPVADKELGALTQALVATQTQLAERELQDKNYAAAAAQAASALKHAPGHAEAARVLATARDRLRELEATVAETRRLLDAGDTAAATQQLSRVLELDPRQPAAAELSARLNTVFRSQAEAAAESMRAARKEAVAAGASADGPFAGAEAQGREGEALVAKGEFADATRTFLEARDAFDRVRRAARTAQAGTPKPVAAATAASAPPGPATAPPRATTAAARPTPTPAAPASVAAATPPPEPSAVARRFAPGSTSIATREAGGLQGFDSTDVHARQVPQFTGRMEFEVLPATVRPGEPFVVRIHLVNEGRRPVKVRAVGLTEVIDGKRTPASAHALQREVAPQQRGLVAEYSAVWAATDSWSLETVVTADRDETIANRLDWN